MWRERMLRDQEKLVSNVVQIFLKSLTVCQTYLCMYWNFYVNGTYILNFDEYCLGLHLFQEKKSPKFVYFCQNSKFKVAK